MTGEGVAVVVVVLCMPTPTTQRIARLHMVSFYQDTILFICYDVNHGSPKCSLRAQWRPPSSFLVPMSTPTTSKQKF